MHVVELWANSAKGLENNHKAQVLTSALRDHVINAPEFFLYTDSYGLLQVGVDAKCDTIPFVEPTLVESSDKGMSKACLGRMAKRMGAKAFFWGHLFSGEGGRLSVKLHLWQQGEDRSAVLPYEEKNPRRVVERLYQHLVAPGRVGDLRLVADGGVPRGELYVNGRPAGPFDGEGGEWTVPVGEVAVEVKAGDKVLARGKGVVAASGVATVPLKAVVERVPSPPASTAPAEPVRTPLTPPAEPVSSWQRPVGWAGVATGAVLLGVGVFATLRKAGLEDDFDSDRGLAQYRAGVHDGSGVCDVADRGVASAAPGAASPSAVSDHCSSLSLMRTLQPVGLVGGGLLAVGGAVLLLTAPSGAAAPTTGSMTWRFLPSAGTSSVGGAFRLAW